MVNVKKAYDGQTASEDAQIEMLRQIGLIIKNPSVTKKCLAFVGYYRFFSYVKPFIQPGKTIDSEITFEHVWDLYVFDRKLRLLVIDAIERIEVAFRVSISEIMALAIVHFGTPRHITSITLSGTWSLWKKSLS